ncbi:MAG TPA: hypothetical protein VH561_21565 [Micromonosporaceae bacterium]
MPDDQALRARYFVLEEAWSPIDARRYTVIAEWTKDGSHLNGGPGPEPERASFLAAVAARLSLRDRRS